MKSNLQSITLPDYIRKIDKSLDNIENTLKEVIKESIEEIKKDQVNEKELIALWASHANNISDFFFEECETADNKGLYKAIVKYMMFNK